MDMQDAPLVYELATEMPIRLLKLLFQSLQYCLLCVIVFFWEARSQILDPLSYASLNRSFIEDFIILNTITFTDMTKRDNNEILWDVRRVSSL